MKPRSDLLFQTIPLIVSTYNVSNRALYLCKLAMHLTDTFFIELLFNCEILLLIVGSYLRYTNILLKLLNDFQNTLDVQKIVCATNKTYVYFVRNGMHFLPWTPEEDVSTTLVGMPCYFVE